MTQRHFLTTRAIGRLLAAFAALGILVALTIWGRWGLAETTPDTTFSSGRPTRDLLTVGITPVREASFYATEILYTGQLEARRASELAFERVGRLVDVMVEEGDVVTPGQELAQLDKRRLEAQRNEAEAQRRAAKALWDEMKAGPRKEVVSAARAEVARLEAEQQNQERDRSRIVQLWRNKAASKAEYDRAVFGAEAADARLDAANRRLDELLAGTRVEKLEAQQAVVKQWDAIVAQLEIDLEDSTLSAPFGGRISHRYLDEGNIVAAATPVLRIIESNALECWIGMPPSTADGFSPGQNVQLEIDGKFAKATVSGRSAEIDAATRTQRILFRLSDAADFAPAMLARITAETIVPTPGFWIPNTALVGGTRGLWAVGVVEPNQGDANNEEPATGFVGRREVEVLHQIEQHSFVRGTLSAGDWIISSGFHRVVDGQQVVTKQAPSVWPAPRSTGSSMDAVQVE